MGSAGVNFYRSLVTRYGFGEAANAIQSAFLAGRRTEAAGLVPDAMIDELCLVGPVEAVRDRLDAWRASGATTLLAKARDVDTVRAIADAAVVSCASGVGRADRPEQLVVPRRLDRDVGVLTALVREPEREELEPHRERDLREQRWELGQLLDARDGHAGRREPRARRPA